MGHTLDRIVLVPRNGYVNRIQSWASAAILAADLDVSLKVAWEPEPVAPAAATDLFSSVRVDRSFVGSEEVTRIVGAPHAMLPRYLTVLPERRAVVLAGHDRGEQFFMPELESALNDPCRPTTLILIAGGKFHLPDAANFARQRRVFYRSLDWSNAIDSSFAAWSHGRPPYLAVHIRQTDRSREAPRANAIAKALRQLGERTGLTTVFIAADTGTAREQWLDIAARLGFAPWTATHDEAERSMVEGSVAAMVDWRLLGCSVALAYSATSSFGEEAAVAAGAADASIALSASPVRQRARAGRDAMRSALTHPRRHGWPPRRG